MITWSAPGVKQFVGQGAFDWSTCTLTETYDSLCSASTAAGNGTQCGDTSSTNADLCPNGDAMIATFDGTPTFSWYDAEGCNANGKNCATCSQNVATSFASGPCAYAAGAWTAPIGSSNFTLTFAVTAQVATAGGTVPITWTEPTAHPFTGDATFDATACTLTETYAVLCASSTAAGNGVQCGDQNSSNVDVCAGGDALTGTLAEVATPSVSWWDALGCDSNGANCTSCVEHPATSLSK
jgi:hypothetical protein